MMSVYINPCAASDARPFSIRMIEVLAEFQAQIVRMIPGCVYIYDLIEQQTVCASCSIATMLGYPEADTQAMELGGLSELIHPDDLNEVASYYQRFTTLKAGDILTLEYRMQRPDGSWCWLRSQETGLTHAIAGYPLQILGVTQDLSTLPPPNSRKRIWLNRLITQPITATTTRRIVSNKPAIPPPQPVPFIVDFLQSRQSVPTRGKD